MKKTLVELLPEQRGQRLDKALSDISQDWSRTYLKQRFDAGEVWVDGIIAKASQTVKGGERVEVLCPDTEPIAVEPVHLDLDFVYEDETLIVVNKPSGLTVHPSATQKDVTLVHGLLAQADQLAEDEALRPGIVHRIDKETSGLLVVAKTTKALRHLQQSLKSHKMTREYLALVDGVIPHDKGRIDAPIGRDKKQRQNMAVVADGRPSITHFEVLERFPAHTFVRCRLESGRTHQIRVHMRYIGYPIYGDPKYGQRRTDIRHGQFLHAGTLGFEHPKTGEALSFSAPLPDFFAAKLAELRQTGGG
ncbi:MAG: RluA family pseudouridine synthase [Acholeplasmatales bacterium]|nr:MAG: RluA family pseudouridine synthase [Acholeplasmatales bacterium]